MLCSLPRVCVCVVIQSHITKILTRINSFCTLVDTGNTYAVKKIFVSSLIYFGVCFRFVVIVAPLIAVVVNVVVFYADKNIVVFVA